MKKIKGDLIQLAKNEEFDLIAHGCNCFNNFGAGIALQMKTNFPTSWEVDRNTIKGHKRKLGNFTIARSDSLVILNMYTQFNPGNKNPLSENYSAIRSCFKQLKERYPDKKIGIPAIGSGLAGGDFDTIWNIIEEETQDLNITMVIYEKL